MGRTSAGKLKINRSVYIGNRSNFLLRILYTVYNVQTNPGSVLHWILAAEEWKIEPREPITFYRQMLSNFNKAVVIVRINYKVTSGNFCRIFKLSVKIHTKRTCSSYPNVNKV